MSTSTTCPCGRPRPFAQCCEPVITGLSPAASAETLMRSRYSAYATGAIDYLIATHHPNKRHANDRQEISDSQQGCEWLSLRVLDTQAGGEADAQGEVEFIASYKQGGQPGLLHERSRFVKEDGRWFYLDGDLYETAVEQQEKLGRNDPCWCGSGKKFKKCHGG